MPAAAVIPAPIVYANVVAVTKLVVGLLWIPFKYSIIVLLLTMPKSYLEHILYWNLLLDNCLCLLLLWKNYVDLREEMILYYSIE